jgi:hypothetical protein
MTSDIKLCKDCKHTRKDRFGGWRFSECHRPGLGSIDLADGSTRYPSHYCSVSRRYDCGQDARYFEPKPVKLSLWQRLKTFLAEPGTNSAGLGGPTLSDIAKLPCAGRQGGPR